MAHTYKQRMSNATNSGTHGQNLDARGTAGVVVDGRLDRVELGSALVLGLPQRRLDLASPPSASRARPGAPPPWAAGQHATDSVRHTKIPVLVIILSSYNYIVLRGHRCRSVLHAPVPYALRALRGSRAATRAPSRCGGSRACSAATGHAHTHTAAAAAGRPHGGGAPAALLLGERGLQRRR